MAERRMFAKTIIDSDAFLDMPLSTQALYFHLSMRGDDDGFVNNPKKIVRAIGATDDELRLLLAKGFIFLFESGVVVIKHWKIHNYIQADRYKPTAYTDEMELLRVKENKAYTLGATGADSDAIPDAAIAVLPACIHDGYKADTQVRLDKDRLGKASGGKRGRASRFSAPTKQDVEAYVAELGAVVDAARFVDYYAAQGWKLSNGNAMKDWRAAVRNWAKNDRKKGGSDASTSEYAHAF